MNQMKQIKRCLCVFGLLVAILFLLLIASLSYVGVESLTIKSRIQLKNEEILSANAELATNFTLFMEQLTKESMVIMTQLDMANKTISSLQNQLHRPSTGMHISTRVKRTALFG